MIDALLLVGGLLLILWGANALTDGAASVAKRFNISNLVIGLTIVAFGTSAPEFVISFLSSFNGNAGLAIGNVVGSNIFNTLMIVGCTAIVAPIPVGKGTLAKEIPLCVLSALMLFVCANDILLDGAGSNVISRTDGLILLGFFAIFMGKSCPEALGDYFAGPNHTLPTSGTARFSSPLSVDDFVKKSQFTYYTRDALSKVADKVAYFADREGLSAHARSATVRFEGDAE